MLLRLPSLCSRLLPLGERPPGRVGHRRGTTHIALFPWPPAERRLQVSKHGALQCLCPFPVSIRPVVAFSISDTSLLNTPSTCLASPCGQLSWPRLFGRDSDE